MKMDDSTKSGAGLEVSVSFGRFENNELSWEKWSSFSQNKYMEEIGTLSTPGSVAQKKAYFEAHYKKIAAKKAEEELEQEKSMGLANPSPDASSEDDAFAKSSENGIEFGGDGLVEEEPCITALKNVAIVEEDDARSSEGDGHGACTNGFVDAKTLEVEVDAVQSEGSAVEEAKDVMNVNIDNPELDFRNEVALVVGLEAPQKDSQRILKEPPERKNGVKKTKKEIPKVNARTKVASKVTPTKKEKVLAETKKKAVSPAVKTLQASTPKYSKPTSVSRPVSASQPSIKKVNASAPPKSKKSSPMRESKRTAPTSLHMSLSLGPSDSLGPLPMTRKSLIMESMGDKDIVRRAFRTFQNRTNASIYDGKPSTVKNVSATAFEPKMSSYHTPTKGNEGPRKDAEKRINQRSQAGSRSNPLPSGSHKSSSVPKKSPMPISPATGLRSDEKAEKRKEFLKKLEAKSIARMAENAQPGARSTVGVENGIRQRPTLKR